MKEPFYIVFNKLMKRELVLMYGENYDIRINSLEFSTQKKCYVFDVTLICENCTDENIETFYPDGLDYIINRCWKFLSIDYPVTLISSIEFKKNT